MVVCEGYESSEDPYILAGSCGLEYSLFSTGHRQRTSERQYTDDYHQRSRSYSSSSSNWSTLIMLGVLGYIAWQILKPRFPAAGNPL